MKYKSRYERIYETLSKVDDADLIILWNDRCDHHNYYGDYIRNMYDFDEIESPIDPELTFSEQITSIKIDFEDFDTNDDYYNHDDLDHYHSFNNITATNSPFDMAELAMDIDDYADYYVNQADSLCYLDEFKWLVDEIEQAEEE